MAKGLLSYYLLSKNEWKSTDTLGPWFRPQWTDCCLLEYSESWIYSSDVSTSAVIQANQIIYFSFESTEVYIRDVQIVILAILQKLADGRVSSS